MVRYILVSNFVRYYRQVFSRYLQHMSSILTSTVKKTDLTQEDALPTPIFTLSPPSTPSPTMSSSTDSLQPLETTTFADKLFGQMTCPSYCTCSCPSKPLFSSLGTDHKNVDVDITLLPCARTAAYQLDLAIKLCRRKKSQHH